MKILADVNVSEEYVSALRGDGHSVQYKRDIDALGSEATDDAIVAYAESEGLAILMTVFLSRRSGDPLPESFVAAETACEESADTEQAGPEELPPGAVERHHPPFASGW